MQYIHTCTIWQKDLYKYLRYLERVMGELEGGQDCPLKIPLDFAQWWRGV